MKYKSIIGSLFVAMVVKSVLAQSSVPASVKVPVMAFDKTVIASNKAKDMVMHEDLLPILYELNGVTIELGKVTLLEITASLKTGNVLYSDGNYYQCYNLPKYSQQIWFVVDGNKLDNPVTEIVIAKGGILPSDYCPLITANGHPAFSNKLRLGFSSSLLNVVLAKPVQESNNNAVYLFQLPLNKKLKVQTVVKQDKLERIKVTLQSDNK